MTRRQLFAAVAGAIAAAGAAVIAKVLPKRQKTAIEEWIDNNPLRSIVSNEGLYTWTGGLFSRSVYVDKRFGPKDELLHLDRGLVCECDLCAVDIQPGDVIYFPKTGGRGVYVTARPIPPFNQSGLSWGNLPYVVRSPDKHSQRITLQPGDVGYIIASQGGTLTSKGINVQLSDNIHYCDTDCPYCP